MPFVQRNWKGEITGLFGVRQPGYADEELTEDHPEVLSFRMAHPISPEMLRPLSANEIGRLHQERIRLDREHVLLRSAILSFNAAFIELETALSALLHTALRVPNSQVAYAIYYSPHGFDIRSEIVHNTILQLISENDRLEELLPLWSSLYRQLPDTRRIRNSIAHGIPITLAIRGKSHARLTSAPFDANRVGRHVKAGRVPGLTASDVRNGAAKAHWVAARVDELNRVFSVFYDEGNPALAEKIRELAIGLQTKAGQ